MTTATRQEEQQAVRGDVRFARHHRGKGSRPAVWWRYDSGWTACSPEHGHTTIEQATNCLREAAKESA